MAASAVRESRVVGRARRTARVMVELVERELVIRRIQRRNVKSIIARCHLCELFFTWNGAGESHHRIARRHRKAQRERNRWRITRTKRSMREIAGLENRLQQRRCNTLTAVRRLNEKVADVALLLRVARDGDPDNFAVIARRPGIAAFTRFERKPNAPALTYTVAFLSGQGAP